MAWVAWLAPRRDPGREARAKLALSSMGASVFSVRAFLNLGGGWCEGSRIPWWKSFDLAFL